VSLELLKAKKNAIVSVIALAAALGLLVYNSVAGPGRRASPLSRAVLSLMSYPQAMVAHTAFAIGDTWDDYIALRGVKKENRRLRKELEELSFSNQKLKEEVARLRMNLPGEVWPDIKLLSAKIIGLPARSDMKVVTINKGVSDGISYGMPVVCGRGVAGRIIGGGGSRKVPLHSSQVLLVTDPRCRVDALVYRMDSEKTPDPECPWNPDNWFQTRVRGVVQGNGRRLKLKFVERGSNVERGDMVVSSGLGGVFPKGLLLGRVSNVKEPDTGLTLDIDVEPAVDLNSLEEVKVLLKDRRGSD